MTGTLGISHLRSLALAVLLSVPLVTAGAIQAASQEAHVSPHQMFVETASPADMTDTVTVFMEEVEAAGWSHLTTHDMGEILAAQGFTLDPVLIVEVCSGKYSAQLLGNDDTRFVASMIPCRVAIYQTSEGQVIISRMNTTMMAGMMPPTVAEVITASGNEVEAIIEATLARLQ